MILLVLKMHRSLFFSFGKEKDKTDESPTLSHRCNAVLRMLIFSCKAPSKKKKTEANIGGEKAASHGAKG